MRSLHRTIWIGQRSWFLQAAFAITLVSTALEIGCNGFFPPNAPPPQPPPGGFSVAVTLDNGTGTTTLDPSATVETFHNKSICSTTASQNPAGATCPAVGNVGQTAGYIGNNQFISGAIVAGQWSGFFRSSTINPAGGPCDPLNGTPWGPTNFWYRGLSYTVATCNTGVANGQFFASASLPSSLTVQASGFSSASGMPQLNLYSLKNGQITQLTATSVSGSASATFGFPKNSNGSALASGVYSYSVSNKKSGGIIPFANGLLSIGSVDTSKQTPMGIDAADESSSTETCTPINQYGTIGCNSSSSDSIIPVYTLETPGQVCGMACVTVGGQPVQVKVFGAQSQTYGGMMNGIGSITTVTGPSLAAVANYSNNEVNIVNVFEPGSTVATVNVGLQPIALVLNSNNTKAYVANFGSASVSEVSLTPTYAQTRVVNVGSSPAALAMDPSGNAIWVGGLNYISKIDLTTFSVVSNITVSGQVNALGISAGQNQFVYSTVTNSGANANFVVSHAQFVTGANAKADYQYSIGSSSPLARFYSLSNNTNSSTPPGWVNAGGVLVSALYGNRYVVNGTPTGFLVMDLQSGTQMLQGSTASPVRGIATDPAQGTVFLTAPDSNSLVTLPLPPVQAN